MSLIVTQPVINNTTGIAGGTLTLTPDTTEMNEIYNNGSLLTANPLSGTTATNGDFNKVNFIDATHRFPVGTTASSTTGNFFIVKNVGAISAYVRLFNNNAGSIAINKVNVASGGYIDFGLSSGKKLIFYTANTGKVAVTYL